MVDGGGKFAILGTTVVGDKGDNEVDGWVKSIAMRLPQVQASVEGDLPQAQAAADVKADVVCYVDDRCCGSASPYVKYFRCAKLDLKHHCNRPQRCIRSTAHPLFDDFVSTHL